jgi:ribosomal protein L11 methyltransferase
VSEIIGRACPGGVAVEAPFEVLQEGLAARVDTARPAVVRGYITAIDPAAARSAVDAVRRDLGHLQAFALRPIGELETRIVHEEDWADAWKEHFPVMRIGRHVVVQPTWREYESTAGDVIIRLDPGMAFGTGLHPTTRLCLAAIEDLAAVGGVREARVLDVGTGSGILAICAALFGAHSIVAVDTDPLAVVTTRQNVALNGLESVIEARQGSVPLAGGTEAFDLVVANLIAGLLMDLAEDLAAVVWPVTGRLLVSGVFHEREFDVRSAFESAGLEVVRRHSEGEWLALEAVRPA